MALNADRAPPSLADPVPLRFAARIRIYGAFLVVILCLFHRLFLGEVFSSGAGMLTLAPFRTVDERELLPFINDSLGDQWRQFNVFAKEQRKGFQEGRFPLWNPNIFCGHPIHANGQSAFLSPFHIPYYFVDSNLARGPIAILRMWICAIATFHFARRLGISNCGAFLSGIVWTFGSFNIRYVGLNNITNVTFWMPVMLLAVDRYLVMPSIRRWAIVGFATAVMQLGGHPETQFLAGVCCGLFAIARTLSLGAPISSVLGSCFGVAFGMTIGTLATAASLLPFVYQMINSYEWHDGPYGKLPGFPWEACKQFLLPDIFGRPRAGFTYTGPMTYHEPSLWIGIIPLSLSLGVFAFTAFRPRQNQSDEFNFDPAKSIGPKASNVMIWFWIILAMVCAIGVFESGPLRTVLSHTPVLGKSQLSRLCLLYQFATAMLAGYAIDRLLLAPTLRWACCGAGFLLVSLAAICFMQQAARFPAIEWNNSWRINWHDPTIRNWGNILLAGIGVLSFAMFRSIRAGFVIAIVTAELLWSAWDLNPTCPPAILDPPTPPQLSNLMRAGNQRIIATDFVLSPNLSTQYDFRDVRGYDFPTPRRWAALMHWLKLSIGFTTIDSKSLLVTSPSQHLLEFLDITAARFICSDQREVKALIAYQGNTKFKAWQLISHNTNGFDAIYENPNALPRARIARGYKLVWSTENTTRYHSHTNLFNWFRRDSDVCVAEVKTTGPIDRSSNQDTGTVTFERDAAEEVILQVQTSTGGMIVLADRMDDGWNVEVDGQPAEALWTDYLFRGVIVPPGNHNVRWYYTCPGLRSGIWLSAGSLLFLAICGIRGRRRCWIGRKSKPQK